MRRSAPGAARRNAAHSQRSAAAYPDGGRATRSAERAPFLHLDADDSRDGAQRGQILELRGAHQQTQVGPRRGMTEAERTTEARDLVETLTCIPSNRNRHVDPGHGALPLFFDRDSSLARPEDKRSLSPAADGPARQGTSTPARPPGDVPVPLTPARPSAKLPKRGGAAGAFSAPEAMLAALPVPPLPGAPL